MMAEDPSSPENQTQLLDNDSKNYDALTTPKNIPISTKYGYVLVTQQGPPNRTAIVTYHDVGYNSKSQFHDFFSYPEMMTITEHFTIYHINAPGQEDRANPLPTAAIYPTMDQLAETVNDVFNHLDIKAAVGFGVGLGGNVLTRFALKYPSKMYGLILINGITRGAGWLEGLTLKWPTKDVPEQHWTASLMNYLLWYHLGPETQSSQPDLVQILRQHLEENINVKNVIKLLNSFFKRTSIPLVRRTSTTKHVDSSRVLQCGVLNITGASSPHKDDVIETNDRCDPKTSSYVEFAECGGAVLDEQPAKTAEAIRLFLQGLGYMSYLSIPRFSVSNRLEEQSAEYKRHHGSFSKVPRRLSTQLSSDSYQRDIQDDEPEEFEEELQLRADTLDNRSTQA